VVLELNGIFVNLSHMMHMIKWILMSLSARMETVMTGVYSNSEKKYSTKLYLPVSSWIVFFRRMVSLLSDSHNKLNSFTFCYYY